MYLKVNLVIIFVLVCCASQYALHSNNFPSDAINDLFTVNHDSFFFHKRICLITGDYQDKVCGIFAGHVIK